MSRKLVSLFNDHPASVDETYLEHMWFASRAAGGLFKAGLAALVHAVFPFLCVTTASETIITMHDDMTTRRRQAAQGNATEARTA